MYTSAWVSDREEPHENEHCLASILKPKPASLPQLLWLCGKCKISDASSNRKLEKMTQKGHCQKANWTMQQHESLRGREKIGVGLPRAE